MPHPARQRAPRYDDLHLPGRVLLRGPRAVAAPGLVLGLVLGLSGALPSATRASEGLYLTWNDCYQGAAQTSNLDFACDTNTGDSELYVAFTMPQSADGVVAVEIVVDLQHSATSLPDWWRLEPDGCRWPMGEPTNIAAAVSFPGQTACLNMWQGAATPAFAEVAGYIPSQTAARSRIKVTGAVNTSDARTLDGTSMYYAARIILSNNRTVGSPSCAGCEGAACLVLNSILIGRLDGSPGGNYFLQIPGPGDANWALWQGGSGADCAAVPVRNRAWGQLKGLYR